MPKVSFIGVGAMRCGASSIYERLSKGTNLVPPSKNCEPKDKYSYKEARTFLGRFTTEEYHSLFPSIKGIRGEWSPMYILYEDVLEKIYEYNKDIKIIFAVRDPIERLMSEYKKHSRNNTIFDAINRSAKNKIKDQVNFTDALVYGSMYGDHIKRLYNIFPKENVFIVKFENMAMKQQEVIDSLIAFTGLSKTTQQQQRYLHVNKWISTDVINKQDVISSVYDYLFEDTELFNELTGIDYRSSYVTTN